MVIIKGGRVRATYFKAHLQGPKEISFFLEQPKEILEATQEEEKPFVQKKKRRRRKIVVISYKKRKKIVVITRR